MAYEIIPIQLGITFHPLPLDPKTMEKLRLCVPHGIYIQENYNTPLEHTPGNPPGQLWKESLYSLLVKV